MATLGEGSNERLSTRALVIPFVGRAPELRRALAHLSPSQDEVDGRTLLVSGDSGTGKSFFVRELMRQMHARHADALYLYVDVANDEYQSARTLAALLKIALVPGVLTDTGAIGVPEAISLQRYRRELAHRGWGRGFLRTAANAVGLALGVGPGVSAALDMGRAAEASVVEDELAAYLAWVAKRQPAFVVVDNVQFLNLDVRLNLESVLQRVGKNVRLIAVNRTVDGVSELHPPIRCFAEGMLKVRLTALSSVETRRLIAGAIGDHAPELDRLAQDIFTKTSGLAKDVEYCLRQYVLELGRGARVSAIEGLLSTVDRLPLIHRQLLVIAALLDGGVDKRIACSAVRRLVVVHDEASLDSAVDELITRDYLRLNGETGNRLRPGHERVVTAIRTLAEEELQEDVRRSLIDELATTLDSPEGYENETYLLHCLVGLQTARELARNIHYISRLIQHQYRQDQFSYLVALADEVYEIMPLLPEHAIHDLLDAMQKSCAFERGLQLVQHLDGLRLPGAAARRIYRLKYLTQAYRYEDALTLSEDVENIEWRAVYRINALLALDRVEEARAMTESHLSEEVNECQAVLRRNAVTLFPPETSLRLLDEAYAYFDRGQSDFRLATIETNRSVVYLSLGRLGEALGALNRAQERMRAVGSREVYQAQINLAVRAAMLGNYDGALDLLRDAALLVPRALLLDQVKIRMNRTVLECVRGALGRAAALETFDECLEATKGLQMPYLRQALLQNTAMARATGPAKPPAPRQGRVALDVPLEVVTWGASRNWTLLQSVHWRY